MSTGFDFTLNDPEATRQKYADVPENDTSTSARSTAGKMPDMGFDQNYYSKKSNFQFAKVPSEFYFNGPQFDPYDHHSTQVAQVRSMAAQFGTPAQRKVADNFVNLMRVYGHTNSAGTLYGLAEADIDMNSDAVKAVLEADAKNQNAIYQQVTPTKAGSPAAQAQAAQAEDPGYTSILDRLWPDDLGGGAKWLTRNVGGAANMLLEASQGSIRGVGGALSEGDFSKAFLTAVTANPLLAATVDGGLIPDDQLENPWEQTTYGQQLLSANSNGQGVLNPFNPAYNEETAGLDSEKALSLLQTDPRYTAQRDAVIADPTQQQAVLDTIAQENNLYGQPGWFVEETSQIGEKQRQSTYKSWAIPWGPEDPTTGERQLSSWTPGRGIASAVLSPDSEAAATLSGVIDFTATILGDPLTYLPAIGLPSKTLRLAGKAADAAVPGVKGAERVLTRGMERRKEFEKFGLTNRLANKLVDEWNDAAVRAGNEDDVVTRAEWASMGIAEQADMAKNMMRVRAMEEAQKVVKPEVEEVRQRIRSLRRSASATYRADRVEQARTLPTTDADIVANIVSNVDARFPAKPAKATWEGDSYGTVRIEQTGRGKWNVIDEDGSVYEEGITKAAARASAQERHGENIAYSDWLGSMSRSEKAAFKRVTKIIDKAEKDGEFTPPYPEWRTREEWIANTTAEVEFVRTKIPSLNQPKPKFAKEAHEVALRMVLEGRMAPELSSVDTAGVTTATNPMEWSLAVHDGETVVTRWAGDAEPNLVDDITPIDTTISEDVLQKTLQVLKDHQVRPARAKSGEALAGWVSKRINSLEHPEKAIAAVLRNPRKTWRDVLNVYASVGLDGYLDDFLRAHGIDGIGSASKVTRDGVWMGDHPMMESYMIPRDITTTAQMYGGTLDKAAFMAQLPELVPAGLWHAGKPGIDVFREAGEQGVKRARDERNVYNGTALTAARTAQVDLDARYADLEDSFSNPREALRRTLAFNGGMAYNKAKGVTVDTETLRWFMFGNGPFSGLRKKTFEKMANLVSDADRAKFNGLVEGTDEWRRVWTEVAPDYLGRLAQSTSKRWDDEVYREVLKNSLRGGGEEGLLRTLSPYLGVSVQPKSIGTGLATDILDGAKMAKGIRRPSGAAIRTFQRAAGERPGQRNVDVNNVEDVIDTIVKYGMYTKMDPARINYWVGKAIADGDSGLALAVNNITTLKTFANEINKKLLSNLDEFYRKPHQQERKAELGRAITDSTRLFLGGQSGEVRDVMHKVGSDLSIDEYKDDIGNAVPIPSIVLESELRSGFVTMPNVDEWGAAINRVGAYIAKYEPVEGVYRFARRFYDNFYRTGLLIWRGAYMMRNAAEMQFRMFLNGHESIFSDPFSLVGMTLGNHYARDKTGPLARLFQRYDQTVLGTNFYAGKDAERAIAEHVEDYQVMMRQSNSLTDPRVYQSAVTTGWRAMGVDAPQWTNGWANELILLHRSDIARAVMGDSAVLPGGLMRPGMSDSEFKGVVLDWFTSDDALAAGIRAKMIGHNENWVEVFNNRAMLQDYLFDSPNSVQAQINKFTLNGDPILRDFVLTGQFKGEGLSKNIRAETDLRKRISGLSNMLTTVFYEGGAMKAPVRDHFIQSKAFVPWIDGESLRRKGFGLADTFFRWSNTFERLSTVGPEFRLAYWDKVAELAQGLRAEDADTVLAAARTTLSPIRRMIGESKLDDIGRTHPAWDALNRAKASGSDGMLTAQDVHTIAMDHAADAIKDLFYDAARRNNFWAATRLIWPFGQSWGNTINEWSRLGMQNKTQVYKVWRAFHAANQEGTQDVYEEAPGGMVNEYMPGMAPWDQDPHGGMMFKNQYGDESFMIPFASHISGGVSALLGGSGQGVDQTSTVGSINLAVGGESVLPGLSSLVPLPLSFLPDNAVTRAALEFAAPFGTKNPLEAAIPSWLAPILAAPGTGNIPGFEGLSILSPQTKNKNVRDVMTMLFQNGQYDLTDPRSKMEFQRDVQADSARWLLIEGLAKNASPAGPTMQYAFKMKDGKLISAAMMAAVYNQYINDFGMDSLQAKQEMIRLFGPEFVMGLVGKKSDYTSTPSSEAMDWAAGSDENRALLMSNPEEVIKFFPKGDPGDVYARKMGEDLANRTSPNRTAQEIADATVASFMQVQYAQIDAQVAAGTLTKEQARAAKDEVRETYSLTSAGQQFNTQTTEDQLKRFDYVYDKSESIRQSLGGQAYNYMREERRAALERAREITGDSRSTLEGDRVKYVREQYVSELNRIRQSNPALAPIVDVFLQEVE